MTLENVHAAARLLRAALALTLAAPALALTPTPDEEVPGTPAAVPLDGRIETMEEVLERREATPVATGPHYLHVVLRIGEDGSAQVVSATRLPGTPVGSAVLKGAFVAEVKRDGDTVALQSMVDPFEQRSFAPLDHPERGHHLSRAKQAEVVVKIPVAADADLPRFSIRLYRLRPAARVEQLTPETFRTLQQRDLLQRQIELLPDRLAPQLRARLGVVTPPP